MARLLQVFGYIRHRREPTPAAIEKKLTPMFTSPNKEAAPARKRSVAELRAQLRTLDAKRMRELRGGQGVKVAAPQLLTCGGWLPQ